MACLVGVGLDVKVADALREDLMPWVQETYPGFPQGNFQQPFYRLPESMTETLHEYVETKSREYAAMILETAPENLLLEQSYGAMYTNLRNPLTQKPDETTVGKAVTILALGTLSTSNGLPKFEDAVLNLNSGELLAAPLDKPQHFKGRGGGLGHVCIWGMHPSKEEVVAEKEEAEA